MSKHRILSDGQQRSIASPSASLFLLINEETDSKYISIRLYTRLRKMSTLAMFNEKHPSHCIEFQGTQ